MESKGDISIEKRADLIRWANTTIEHVTAVRNGAVQIPEGQTKDFYVKKYLLGSIAGDDMQVLSFSEDYFIPQLAGLHKECAIIRLDFEIASEELPQEIRAKLEKFRGFLKDANISQKQGYLKTKDKYKKLEIEVKRYINKDKSLGMTFLI